jgi:hypothetical protein
MSAEAALTWVSFHVQMQLGISPRLSASPANKVRMLTPVQQQKQH